MDDDQRNGAPEESSPRTLRDSHGGGAAAASPEANGGREREGERARRRASAACRLPDASRRPPRLAPHRAARAHCPPRPDVSPHQRDRLLADRGALRGRAGPASFIDRHRPEWSAVRWINVDGLGDLGVIRILAEEVPSHPCIEDVLHVPQRPKCRPTRRTGVPGAALHHREELGAARRHAPREQVSIFVGHKTVLTLPGDPGRCVGPIRSASGRRVRRSGERRELPRLLVIDAIVDEAVRSWSLRRRWRI